MPPTAAAVSAADAAADAVAGTAVAGAWASAVSSVCASMRAKLVLAEVAPDDAAVAAVGSSSSWRIASTRCAVTWSCAETTSVTYS